MFLKAQIHLAILTPAYHQFPGDIYLTLPNAWWDEKKVKKKCNKKKKEQNMSFLVVWRDGYPKLLGILPKRVRNLKQISFAVNSRKRKVGEAERIREIPQRYCNHDSSRGFIKWFCLYILLRLAFHSKPEELNRGKKKIKINIEDNQLFPQFRKCREVQSSRI